MKTHKRLITILLGVFLWILIKVFMIGMVTAQTRTIKDIPVPKGYERIAIEEGSFGEYIRNLTLRDDNVLRYYNNKIVNSDYYAVLTLDIENNPHLRCTDVIQKIRAEYLYSKNKQDEIAFIYRTDFKERKYKDSRLSFEKYMHNVYLYANSASLGRQMFPQTMDSIQIGDVFVAPDIHTMMVVDVAENYLGKRIFLLAEGSTPACDMYVLLNFESNIFSPWFVAHKSIFYGAYTEKELKTW